jgi:UDP-4-amino-4-deoxy-L-arabinose-oxoglutarate aminotransferase
LWDIPAFSCPQTLPEVDHAWHLFSVWIGDGRRDHVVQKLQEAGVSVMVNYRAIHLLSYFRETFGFKLGDFPNAERIGDATLSLPFYPNMPRAHADLVVAALKRILD